MTIPRFDTDFPLTITRYVTVNADHTVTTAAANVAFRGRVYVSANKRTHPPKDTSKRQSLFQDHDILWFVPEQSQAELLRAGDRISDSGLEYECLTGIRPKRAATVTLINEMWVAPVAALYPAAGQLQELGGAAVAGVPDVPMYMWEESENDTGKGTYRRLMAECPVEFYDRLAVPNRVLHLGSKLYHIDQVTLHLGQPHVTASLRLKT